MRPTLCLFALLALAACASRGPNEVSAAGIGPLDRAVACAAQAMEDEGFVVTSRDDAGLLNARRGDDWIEVNVLPGDVDRHVIHVRTSDSDLARDAADDIVAQCSA